MRKQEEFSVTHGIVAIFFACVVIVGSLTAQIFISNYALARASPGWTTIDGIILSDGNFDGASFRYTYFVNGEVYESSRKRVFQLPFDKADQLTSDPGEKIKVFINPIKNDYSITKPGGSSFVFVVGIGFGSVLTFFGLAGLVRSVLNIGRPGNARESGAKCSKNYFDRKISTPAPAASEIANGFSTLTKTAETID